MVLLLDILETLDDLCTRADLLGGRLARTVILVPSVEFTGVKQCQLADAVEHSADNGPSLKHVTNDSAFENCLGATRSVTTVPNKNASTRSTHGSAGSPSGLFGETETHLLVVAEHYHVSVLPKFVIVTTS